MAYSSQEVQYGLLEPEWDFSGYAPNDVPRDFPNDALASLIVPRAFINEGVGQFLYDTPRHIAEAPRGNFWYRWLTPSQALFIIPSNTAYFGSPSAPIYHDTYNMAAAQSGGDYFVGQSPTTGVYSGVDDGCN